MFACWAFLFGLPTSTSLVRCSSSRAFFSCLSFSTEWLFCKNPWAIRERHSTTERMSCQVLYRLRSKEGYFMHEKSVFRSLRLLLAMFVVFVVGIIHEPTPEAQAAKLNMDCTLIMP